MHGPSRWLLPDTDSRIGKDRTGPDLEERPLYIQYVTEPGNLFGKINPFLPARRRPTVDHSLVAGGAQRQGGSRRAGRMPISRSACSLAVAYCRRGRPMPGLVSKHLRAPERPRLPREGVIKSNPHGLDGLGGPGV